MENICFPILNENDVKQRSIFTVNNSIQVVFITNLKTGKKLDDDYNVNEYLQAVVQANLLKLQGISDPEQIISITRSEEIEDDKTTVVIALDIVTNVQDGIDELRCSISEEGLYSENEEASTTDDPKLWNQQISEVPKLSEIQEIPDVPDSMERLIETTTGPTLRWNSEMTTHLIKIRGDMDAEFAKAKYKFRLWEQVAMKLNDILGQAKVTAKDCDDKWRNIVATYRKNIDKLKCCRDNIIRWEYFSAMDNILNGTKELVNDMSDNIVADEMLVNLMDPLEAAEMDVADQPLDIISVSDENSAIEELEIDDPDESPNDCIITRKFNGEKRRWTTEQCLLLIHLRKQMDNKFRKSCDAMPNLWRELASQMNMNFLSDFTASELESVWNHCNINYEINLENLKSKGVNTISWKYFAVMDDVRGGTREIAEICVPRPGENLLKEFQRLSSKHSIFTSNQTDMAGLATAVSIKEDTDSEDNSLSSSGTVWSQNMIKLLISLKKTIEEDIVAHRIPRKKQWWIMVRRFRALRNVKVSEDACEEKWRNLVRTYKKNLLRVRKRGTGIIRWPYFWKMHEVLGMSVLESEKQQLMSVVNGLKIEISSSPLNGEVPSDAEAVDESLKNHNDDIWSLINDLRDKQNKMLHEIINRQNKKIEELHREQLNIKTLLTQLLQKFP